MFLPASFFIVRYERWVNSQIEDYEIFFRRTLQHTFLTKAVWSLNDMWVRKGVAEERIKWFWNISQWVVKQVRDKVVRFYLACNLHAKSRTQSRRAIQAQMGGGSLLLSLIFFWSENSVENWGRFMKCWETCKIVPTQLFSRVCSKTAISHLISTFLFH